MSQQALLKRVVEALDGAGIPYMLTGSLASSLQGEPRASHDIDLVISITAGDVNDLLEALLDWVRRHPDQVEGRL